MLEGSVHAYRLAWRGCCCPPVRRLVCGVSEIWRAWAGTTSSLGCGTLSPEREHTGGVNETGPVCCSVPGLLPAPCPSPLPSLPVCLAERVGGNMQRRGGPHRAPPQTGGSL